MFNYLRKRIFTHSNFNEHEHLRQLTMTKNAEAIFRRGQYHCTETKNYTLMKCYLITAIDLNYVPAMFALAHYYETIKKNYELMTMYYEYASDRGDTNSMFRMGLYHKYTTKNYDAMKKHLFRAIDNDHEESMVELGQYFESIKNYKLMKFYYEMAIHKHNVRAMIFLADYYKSQVENITEIIFLRNNNCDYTDHLNIEDLDKDATVMMYYHRRDEDHAKVKQYYIMAIDRGSVEAENKLSAYYANSEK